VEALPEPLEHVVADVFKLYTVRNLDDLAQVLHRRYRWAKGAGFGLWCISSDYAASTLSRAASNRLRREDATFIDPTLAARPRSSVGLQFFALQKLFSDVRISNVRIGQPEVHQTKGQQPRLLEVRRGWHAAAIIR
jgi:hypothetical protein